MAASVSHWRSYLGVIVSRERQRLEHFQQAEDILLALLEGVHAREPHFLVDYTRNLKVLDFALCASEDAVTLEIPLRIDGDLGAENLQKDAMELSLLIRGGWKNIRFDIVPVMVLLWSTELFPFPEDWQDLEGSIYRLLVILLRCLATRHLSHFLHPEENLFQGEAPELYCKVESFAQDPQRFLHFHFGLPMRTDSCQADLGTRALLQLPAKGGSYWDTAYFDILLSQFQVYRIQEGVRHLAMSQLLSKICREIPQQS